MAEAARKFNQELPQLENNIFTNNNLSFRQMANDNNASMANVSKDIFRYFETQGRGVSSLQSAIAGIEGEIENLKEEVLETNELVRESILVQHEMLMELTGINTTLSQLMMEMPKWLSEAGGEGGGALEGAGLALIGEEILGTGGKIAGLTAAVSGLVAILPELIIGALTAGALLWANSYANANSKKFEELLNGLKNDTDYKEALKQRDNFQQMYDQDKSNWFDFTGSLAKQDKEMIQKYDDLIKEYEKDHDTEKLKAAGAGAKPPGPPDKSQPQNPASTINGTLSYDNSTKPNTTGSDVSGGGGYIGGGQYTKAKVDPNEIFKYLKSKGLSDNQAFAVLGNISRETGGSFSPDTYTADDVGTGPSGGMFQHHGPRFTNLNNQVPDWRTNWKGQVDFALSEPNMKKFLAHDYPTTDAANVEYYDDFARGKNRVTDITKSHNEIARMQQLGIGTDSYNAKPAGSEVVPTSEAVTGKDLSNVNPTLADAFMKAATEYYKHTGQKVNITSAFRSRADQERLWNNRANNPFPVAKPGTSKHEQGLAIDSTQAAAMDQMGLLRKYGLGRPVPKDAVHIQLLNTPTEEYEAGPIKSDTSGSHSNVSSGPEANHGSVSTKGLSTASGNNPIMNSLNSTGSETIKTDAKKIPPAPPVSTSSTMPEQATKNNSAVQAIQTSAPNAQGPQNKDGKLEHDDVATPPADFLVEFNKWLKDNHVQ